MSKKEEKTNAMRLLDRKKVDYTFMAYDSTLLNAEEVAQAIGQNPGCLFKTLVTVGKSREHYVFMIPADQELDLKKAAKTAGEKSLSMLPQKELLPLTGYIHGGCSPIGMKKQFPTWIHQSAQEYPVICCSAGRVGMQIQLSLGELKKAIPLNPADLIKV